MYRISHILLRWLWEGHQISKSTGGVMEFPISRGQESSSWPSAEQAKACNKSITSCSTIARSLLGIDEVVKCMATTKAVMMLHHSENWIVAWPCIRHINL